MVYAKINPKQELVIRRYLYDIYYCQLPDETKRVDQIYFERELVEDPALEAKNKALRDKIRTSTGEDEKKQKRR